LRTLHRKRETIDDKKASYIPSSVTFSAND
jgi:hypothetical protein